MSLQKALSALVSDAVFVNGAFVKTLTTFAVVNPLTAAVHAQAPQGTPALIDDAVRAADAAFKPWRALSCEARAGYLW